MSDPRQQQYSRNKLVKRLERQVGTAIHDFNMVEEGDRVMVCMSGGKDSYALLEILLTLKTRAPIDFDLIAVNLDQKQPDFPEHVLPEFLQSRGVEFKIVEDTLIVSYKTRFRRVAQRVHCVLGYDGEFSIALRNNWERPRLRSATIWTIWSKHFF